MAIKNRTDLKAYFVKNAIPTEGNFADLIDSQLNQAQDGVFKPDGEPLTVVAAPGNQKRVLRLYADYPQPNPDWTISLNPAQDPATAATTSRPGLGITDGAGKPRLFVDTATGQVGLGTNTPQFTLDVVGGVRASSGLSTLGMVDVTANGQTWGNWFEAIRLSRAEHSAITHPGGKLLFGMHGNRNFYFADTNAGLYLATISPTNGGSLGIGTNGAAACPLHVKSSTSDWQARFENPSSNSNVYLAHGGGNGMYVRTDTASTTNYLLQLFNGSQGGNLFQVATTGDVTIAKTVKVTGLIVPSVGNTENNGILFPQNPGGGGSDRAFIRYHVESAETCTLRIGIDNDADDTLRLWQAAADRLIIHDGDVTVASAPFKGNNRRNFNVEGEIKSFGAGGGLRMEDRAAASDSTKEWVIYANQDYLRFWSAGDRHWIKYSTGDWHFEGAHEGMLKVTGPDIWLDNPDRRDGHTGGLRRAIVHDFGDKLTLNWGNDYTGGVVINGTTAITRIKLGSKWLLSGVGDSSANDEWLRLFNADGSAKYYGGLAAGKLYTETGGGLVQASDLSLKKDIGPLSRALEKVLALRGITYRRRDLDDDATYVGLIAQEVERVFPELVSTGPSGKLGIQYAGLVAPLIEAIKELHSKVVRLEETSRGGQTLIDPGNA